MFHTEYPIFEKGRLLKVEMLESLRDYPQDVMKIYMRGYENGIWKGCDVITRDKKLVIQPGILNFNGNLFILNQEYELPYENDNRLTLLKVVLGDIDSVTDFKMGIGQILLSYEECKENEIELCRFTLHKGSSLRHEYTSFADFNTKYDTLIILNAPYLYQGKITIKPDIMLRFATELMEYSEDNTDYMFAMLILNSGGGVSKEVIIKYLNKKKMGDRNLQKNEEFYNKLGRVLEQSIDSFDQPSENIRRERKVLF